MECIQKANLRKLEARVFSQNGEDGILQHIFSKVGVTNQIFVEFGCNQIQGSNTGNLVLNYSWSGLWIDGTKNTKPEPNLERVRIVQSFITAENIEQLLLDGRISGEIDLLSIDLDGNDYWIWKAIQKISPRVVVIEYNASIDPNWSVTVKYDPKFDRCKKVSKMYHGASLSGLTKLAKNKGYCLIGCDCSGVNAFFVRNDVAKDKIDSMSVQEAYYPHIRRPPNYLELTRSLDFEEV